MEKKYYRDIQYWNRYQRFLPEEMRFKEGKFPDEEWWRWNGNDIHLDMMRNPSSRIKFILLHGGGGNGRLLGTFGTYLYHQGHEYIAPDLPGFGLTMAKKEYRKDYGIWVDIVSDLIDREREKDNRPVVLLGGSIGGMLAYHAACKNDNVKGIIATCLADSRTEEARDALASNKLWSRLGFVFFRLFPSILNHVNIRASWIAKMKHITNDCAFSKVFIGDPLVGKSKMNLGFYRSMTEYNPLIEPENFSQCPLLLVHGENDMWTPYEISKKFFDRIAGVKTCVLLDGAGHYPYEEPGFGQMKKAINDFLRAIR